MNLLSDYYRSVLEKEHSNTKWGIASLEYAAHIADLMQKKNFNEILDYGAGQGNLEQSLKQFIPNVKVYNYDPGIPKWSDIPNPCEMVACIDVLEHVEPEYLDSVLTDLERVIINFGFITVSSKLAGRILNNGWNAHICIKSAKEWNKLLQERFFLENSVIDDEFGSVFEVINKKYENS